MKRDGNAAAEGIVDNLSRGVQRRSRRLRIRNRGIRDAPVRIILAAQGKYSVFGWGAPANTCSRKLLAGALVTVGARKPRVRG